MSTYHLDQIAKLIDAEVVYHQSNVLNPTITAIGTMQTGKSGQIGFLSERQYQKYLSSTELSAVIVDKDYTQVNCVLLVVKDVKQAWRKVVDLFAPQHVFSGIHPRAIIAEHVSIMDAVSIGAGVIIGTASVISQGCVIEAGAIIGRDVEIGEGSYIASGVRILDNTIIGKNAYINSGAVIGSRGFGFSFEQNTWQPIAQLGRVVIGDNVEIGANTTIDRGAVEDTIIHNGVKLDNLIQVGHNVVIGEHTIIAGCCVIAGSTTIGEYCMIGGASVFAGHIDICAHTQITGHSSISKSIKEPGVYSSAFPAMPNKQWNRTVAHVRHLDKK